MRRLCRGEIYFFFSLTLCPAVGLGSELFIVVGYRNAPAVRFTLLRLVPLWVLGSGLTLVVLLYVNGEWDDGQVTVVTAPSDVGIQQSEILLVCIVFVCKCGVRSRRRQIGQSGLMAPLLVSVKWRRSAAGVWRSGGMVGYLAWTGAL